MTNEPSGPDHRPFTQWLAEQRGGALHGELTDALAEVAAGVRDHQKPGAVTLKITLRPAADGSMVIVTDDVKASVPAADRGASLFFTDDNGNLSRRNPYQTELPLRAVEDATEEEVNNG